MPDLSNSGGLARCPELLYALIGKPIVTMEPWTESLNLSMSEAASRDPCTLIYYKDVVEGQDVTLASLHGGLNKQSQLIANHGSSKPSVRQNIAISWLHKLALQFEALPEATKIKSWGDAVSTIFSTPVALAGIFITFSGLAITAFQLIDKYKTRLDEQRKIELSPVQVEMEIKTEVLPKELLIGTSSHKVVKVSIRSSNKSPRDFSVLSTKWVATAYKLETLSEEDMLKQSISQECYAGGICMPILTPAYADSKRWIAFDGSDKHRTIIATGSLFADSIIRPNEVLIRQIVLFVPAGYHYAVFEASLPVVSRLHEELERKKGFQFAIAYKDSGVSRASLYMCPVHAENEVSDITTECLSVGSNKSDLGSASELITHYEYFLKTMTAEIPL